MRRSTKNAYPRFVGLLRSTSAVVALGLFASACTAGDPIPPPAPIDVSAPANPNTEITASERGLIGEVKTAAMCLSSKVLDLSRERNAHPGMTVSKEAVGTTFSINMRVPSSSAVTGEPIEVYFSATMGIDSNGNGDPAKVTETSIVVYGSQGEGTQEQAEPLSLFSLVQVYDGSGWNTFIRGKGQTEGGVYVTLPTDGSNPNVQDLTTDILLSGATKADATIDAIILGAPLGCV